MSLSEIVHQVLLKRRFRFDPNSTEAQGRYRLKDPKQFKRFWTRRDPRAAGVTHIIGIMDDGRFATQAIRFDRDVWSEPEAGRWWSRNSDRFRKVWTPKDWKRKDETLLAEGKPFLDRKHDWGQVIIDRDGERWTRGQIKAYYERVGPKLLRSLRGHDVIVILGMGRNKFVLKRNRDEAKTRIRIEKLKGVEDPTSLEYWINRRAVEFHVAVHGARTDVAWVDIDIHKPKDLAADRRRARSLLPKVARVVRSVAGGSVSTWESGRTGFHVMTSLRDELAVNQLRRNLKHQLDRSFEDREDVTTSIAEPGQIRLDVTTLKNTGSLRAPYSLSVFGHPKKPVGARK
jgi:DNA primase